ncbi:Flp pilus assembly protein CpaB [Rathayibacter caricis DSM 15933]|uniref:Flp pilus assembly protein CpaB n=1 Tax=Rathayibacter caricis DSM 15933 TaxID=1328867 RepID=A0A2T4UQ09_9MICO|nr:RcpC/CpaB family pilus assembly protein [Rathayibacter caricis]PTL71601.1 Flp pilus assembly protein CpaB [Rathayibacter caricis DSM 15933]
MKLRILFAILGFVLAVVGVMAVTLYARGADQRAVADQRPVDVLVLSRDAPAGTPADQLSPYLEVKALPEVAVAPGAATTLDGLGGLVTSIDLVTGEQLLVSRMVSPDALEVPGRVDVPPGLQEVTVLLSPERVVGGGLAAGDTVGVIFSRIGTGQTHMRLQKVLVTTIQGLDSPSEEADASGVAPIPEGSVYVTLAVTASDAELVVNAAEFNLIWLTKEPLDADPNGTRVVTPEDLFR